MSKILDTQPFWTPNPNYYTFIFTHQGVEKRDNQQAEMKKA